MSDTPNASTGPVQPLASSGGRNAPAARAADKGTSRPRASDRAVSILLLAYIAIARGWLEERWAELRGELRDELKRNQLLTSDYVMVGRDVTGAPVSISPVDRRDVVPIPGGPAWHAWWLLAWGLAWIGIAGWVWLYGG